MSKRNCDAPSTHICRSRVHDGEKHTYLKQARTWSIRCVAKQRSWSDHGWNTPDRTWSCFTWFSEPSLFIIFDLVWWRLRLMPPLSTLPPPQPPTRPSIHRPTPCQGMNVLPLPSIFPVLLMFMPGHLYRILMHDYSISIDKRWLILKCSLVSGPK